MISNNFNVFSSLLFIEPEGDLLKMMFQIKLIKQSVQLLLSTEIEIVFGFITFNNLVVNRHPTKNAFLALTKIQELQQLLFF